MQHAPHWLRLVLYSWPDNQLQVIRRFLQAPAAIYACLTMAHDEVKTILDLDVGFLHEFADNVWFYYAETDGWVGEQREAVLRALHATPAEERVVHGCSDITHGFCIREDSFFKFQSSCNPFGKTIAPRLPHNV